MKAQRHRVTCLRSHGVEGAGLGLDNFSPDCRGGTLQALVRALVIAQVTLSSLRVLELANLGKNAFYTVTLNALRDT